MVEMNKGIRSTGSIVVVSAVMAVWLVMGAVDWWMRFRWFRWHNTWIIRADSGVVVHDHEPCAVTNPLTHGGDITRLIGIPSVAARYEEERPATVVWTDEYGYRNYPPTMGKEYPVVVIGDSYMQNGRTMDESFPGILKRLSGVDVYCNALEGVGSFLSVLKFLESERFKEHPPRVLIWGLIEREINAVYFGRLIYDLDVMGRPRAIVRTRTGVNEGAFHPRVLKASLPNTSVLSQCSSKVWNLLRYEVFGQIAPYVIPIEQPIGGRRVLFYYPSIDAMMWDASRRDTYNVARAVKRLDDECRKRGIRLVVLLIPDKEQVYREYIPSRYLTSEKPIPPSCLIPLEQELKAFDIPAVTLLGPYREAAAKDQLLYWADDTHWNTAGIRIAAQLTWQLLRKEGIP